MDWKRIKECCAEYTRDTKTVAMFLKDEAARFNCPTKWLETPEPNGRQRQDDLRLSNFKHVAKHLATQDNFSVPVTIMDALGRVIELRTEGNSIHERQNAKGTAANKSNKSHKHALGIFKDVREVLLRKSPSRPPDAGAEMQILSDMKEPRTARERGSFFGVNKLSFLSKCLKGMRQAIKRCWSKRKDGVNDDAVISEVASF